MDLGTVQKNAREEIRFTAETFQGHDIINIRVWYRNDAGEMRPGKQGLAFRLALLPHVLEMLGKASEGGAA